MGYHALVISCNIKHTYRLGGGYRIATFLRSQGWDVGRMSYMQN